MKYSSLLLVFLLLAGCDSPIQPEIVSVDGKKVPEEKSSKYILVVEEQPKPLTPLNEIWSKFREIAQNNGYQGLIVVQFTVSKTGKVTDPEITKGGNEMINKATIELIRTVEFKPGKQRGRPVDVRYSLPLRTQE